MSLSIPSRTKPGKGSFPTTPGAVRSWLSTLNPLESPESITELYRGLKHCNRLDIPNHLRLEIAEIFAPAVEITTHRLQSHYSQQALPLSVSARAAWIQATRLYRELGFCYKIVVNDTYATLLPGQSRARSQGIYRSLETLARQIEAQLAIHRPVSPALIQEANTLYDLARKSRLEQQAPVSQKSDPEPNTEELLLTIENLFVHIQLLALAQPYNQRRAQIPILQRFLSALSIQIPVLSFEHIDIQSPTVYAIIPDQDSPPQQPMYLDRALVERALMIDIAPMVDLLNEQMHSLPEYTSLLLEPETMLRPTLEKLRESCERTRTRREARAFTNEPVEAWLGWLEITAKLQEMLSNQAGSREIADIPVLKSNRRNLPVWPPRANTQKWSIVNRTAHGVGLAWSGTHTTEIENGQLVLLNAPTTDGIEGDTALCMAIVRWISYPEENTLLAGCEILGNKVREITLGWPKEDSPGQHSHLRGIVCQSVDNQKSVLVLQTSALTNLVDTIMTDKTGKRWSIGEPQEQNQLISALILEPVSEEVHTN